MKYGSEQILPYNQEEQKGTQVKRMFDSIAGTYDLLNHTLSFGIDKIWRRKGIAFLPSFFSAIHTGYCHRNGRPGHFHAPETKSQPDHRGRYFRRHDAGRTRKGSESRFIGVYIVRTTGLYGTHLSGQFIRCRYRRIRST